MCKCQVKFFQSLRIPLIANAIQLESCPQKFPLDYCADGFIDRHASRAEVQFDCLAIRRSELRLDI